MHTGQTHHFADNSFDFVAEVTGNEAGLTEALRLVRPLGRLVLKSTFAGDSQLDLTKMVVNEITVTGSRCGPFAPALRLLAENSIHTAPLIMAEYSLPEAEAALAHAAKPGVLKVLIRP
jgi:threonine dehydrogenase-like Zn-dependent dehydrogenase